MEIFDKMTRDNQTWPRRGALFVAMEIKCDALAPEEPPVVGSRAPRGVQIRDLTFLL